MSANIINVVGNLVDDLTLRYTATSGEAVANGRVAVNERIQRNGNWEDRVNFMNVVVFGGQAENLAASCGKGDRIMVSGRLQTRSYEDDAGNKQYRTEIVASEIGVALRWATVTEVQRVGAKASVGAPAGEPFPTEDPI